MSNRNWGCFKSTAAGCGCALVAAIAIPVVLAIMIMAPLNRALDDRERIEERFGTQADFVPPVSGVPDAARIESFIKVQQALTGISRDLEKAEEQVAALDSVDDREDVSRSEMLRLAFATTRSMMGVGPLIGNLYEIRNRELLAEEMSLGEFTYIFILAYHDHILNPASESQLFGPGPLNHRVRSALRSMIKNQLESLRSGGGLEEEIEELGSEIAALQSDESRIPWQDGLPLEISEAFELYRPTLDELYSPSLAPLILMINEKRGMSIQSN